MRSAALLLALFTSAAAAAVAPPPELARHCPDSDRIAAQWGRFEVSAAAETGSVECVQFVLGSVRQPAEKAARALSRLHDWEVKKTVVLAPVIEALLARVSFTDRKSPAHEVLLGLVEYQEYDLLEKVLTRGANPNVNEREDGRGDTPIALAARHGDNDAIEILLQHGADINQRHGDGQTALHRAVGQKLPATVALLLERGADPDLADVNGLTPWLCACGERCGMMTFAARGGGDAGSAQGRGRQQILELLSPVTKNKPAQKYCNPQSVAYGESLIRTRDLTRLKAMLASDTPPLLNLYNGAGFTPLNQAVFEDREVALLLIGAGADVNLAARDGWTPLHGATQRGDKALIAALLKAGANPAAADRQKRTPLTEAKSYEVVRQLRTSGQKLPQTSGTDALFAAMMREDQETIAGLLEQGVPLRGCGPQGYSLLASALSGNGTGLFWQLLRRGADIHEQCPEHTNLLVHALHRVRDKEERHRIGMELISRGADIHSPDTGGYQETPLMASIGRDPMLTDYLLEKGVNVNVITADGNTALRTACNRFDEPSILRLLEAGADPNLRLPHTSGAANRALSGDDPPLLAVAWRSPRLVESMLVYGADPDARDHQGLTALQRALDGSGSDKNSNPAAALKLLQHGADPHPSAGPPPLAAAIRHYGESGDWNRLFDGLIKRGAVPPRHGTFRPLHFAVSLKQTGAIPALLAAGEEPSAKDQEGRTAFQIAEAVRCTECLPLLRGSTGR